MRSAGLVLALVCLASPASADDDAPDHGWPFARLSMSFGDREIGDVHTRVDGATLAAGYQHPRFALYLEGGLGYQRDDAALSGLASQLVGHVRRTVKRGDWDHEVGFATWVDAGIGWQRFDYGGGALDRPMASIGVGGGADFRTDRKRWIGLSLDLRIEAAPSVDWMTAEARCTGSCAMRLDRYDYGVSFIVSVPFGLRPYRRGPSTGE